MIIPIFITGKECPGRCVYCLRGISAGDERGIGSGPEVKNRVLGFLGSKATRPEKVELAFYGGSFTSLSRPEMVDLLSAAKELREEKLIDTVRISTRPDCLDRETISLLGNYGVSLVEIGAQSLVDEVLAHTCRGHTAGEVARAVGDLKEAGFKTGLHLMMGLPGDTGDRFLYSVDTAISLRPDCVRIHPTLVLAGSALARAWQAGDYLPLALEEAIALAKEALKRFQAAAIPVIRLGLQGNPLLEAPGNILAGPYHPAFGTLVRESLFLEMAAILLAEGRAESREATFTVSPRDESNLRGRKNGNLDRLSASFNLEKITILPVSLQKRESLGLRTRNEGVRLIGMNSLAFARLESISPLRKEPL